MTKIRDNLQIIGAKLKQHLSQYKRSESSALLLAVSKRHSIDKIRDAYEFGQRAFGENYVQELLDKNQQLNDLAIEWHFIGPLQSNKAKKIAEVASWVHAVDRLKIAQRLSDNRPENMPALSICLQVNISGEQSKSGINPDELTLLAKQVAQLPKIKLRGLMVIPAPEDDFIKQREVFAQVAILKDHLQKQLNETGIIVELDTLSMGMSNDIEAAIAEGATIVRVGTAIFGQREN
ncbi:MAG: pyridoxal phosphate enzyme (YggS family) [Cocleimonas sp.]|jgi:pyridoxal phosphate enzyme (YggS family)